MAAPPTDATAVDRNLAEMFFARDGTRADRVHESVKYFRVLPRDFAQETGELTPSLKVKRKVVTERFKSLIDAMYT